MVKWRGSCLRPQFVARAEQIKADEFPGLSVTQEGRGAETMAGLPLSAVEFAGRKC